MDPSKPGQMLKGNRRFNKNWKETAEDVNWSESFHNTNNTPECNVWCNRLIIRNPEWNDQKETSNLQKERLINDVRYQDWTEMTLDVASGNRQGSFLFCTKKKAAISRLTWLLYHRSNPVVNYLRCKVRIFCVLHQIISTFL